MKCAKKTANAIQQLVAAKSTCEYDPMAHSDPDDPRLRPVTAAATSVKRAEQTLKAKRDALAEAVAEAIRAGVRPSAIVKKTGYSAESIRQMARSQGIDPLKPPTVTSIARLRELQGNDEP
jgi:hypothetical protein